MGSMSAAESDKESQQSEKKSHCNSLLGVSYLVIFLVFLFLCIKAWYIKAVSCDFGSEFSEFRVRKKTRERSSLFSWRGAV